MSDRVNPGAAIVGLVFVVLGAYFLLDELDVVRVRPILILPILLIGLGLGLLANASEPSRRMRRPE